MDGLNKFVCEINKACFLIAMENIVFTNSLSDELYDDTKMRSEKKLKFPRYLDLCLHLIKNTKTTMQSEKEEEEEEKKLENSRGNSSSVFVCNLSKRVFLDKTALHYFPQRPHNVKTRSFQR